ASLTACYNSRVPTPRRHHLLATATDVAPRQARSAALLMVGIGQFVVMMAMVPVAAMLPTLADVFHTEFSVISWAVGAYWLALTGLLSDAVGWQWLFWVLWPLGVLALWYARRLPPDSAERRAPVRPDLVGAALLFLTLTVASLSLSHLHGGGETFEAGWAYH